MLFSLYIKKIHIKKTSQPYLTNNPIWLDPNPTWAACLPSLDSIGPIGDKFYQIGGLTLLMVSKNKSGLGSWIGSAVGLTDWLSSSSEGLSSFILKGIMASISSFASSPEPGPLKDPMQPKRLSGQAIHP